MDYVFMMDSDSDLPFDLKEKYDIPVVYMPYALEGKEYFDDLGQTLDHKSYFDRMRNGAVPVTSALNEATYIDYFEPILKEKDLLFVAFSSKLSSTIQAAQAARATLLEKYPNRKLIIVDTLSISMPLTLLALKAHELYRGGAPIEEVADWLEKNKLRAQGWFTVDDLKYLKRGGRISTATALLGTALNVKPVLHVDDEGHLVKMSQTHGRKKSIRLMAEHLGETIRDGSPIIISHADCLKDAELLVKILKEEYGRDTTLITEIGSVIGAHAGPGTLALFFLGSHR